MKKTIIGTFIGAVAGGAMACILTLNIIGYMPLKENTNVKNIPYTENAETGFSLVDDAAEKKALSVEEIAKKTGPSIVGISCTMVTQTFFGTQESSSGGSGIIIDANGHIVTNYHVIEGAKTIKVKLTSGNEYDAKLVGGDEKTDIAVIKIEAKEDIKVAAIGNSNEVEVGELAVAIGNPLASELFGTVTAGVISGVNRTMMVGQREMTLIQTDAAISPGNSGGALINKYGEVIGINSVKLVESAAEGLGFAIPINEAVPIVQDLMKYGYVKGRPMIGVSVREITPELAYYNNLLVDYGLYVMSVTENSGAEKAGITRGDIIIKINDKKVTTSNEMNKIRDEHKAGDTVKLTVLRAGRETLVSVKLTEDMTKK